MLKRMLPKAEEVSSKGVNKTGTLPFTTYQGDQIQANEMGWTFSMHGGSDKCIQHVS
jgi:hypothetical protein